MKLEEHNNLEPKNGDIVGALPGMDTNSLFICHWPFGGGSCNKRLVCTW